MYICICHFFFVILCAELYKYKWLDMAQVNNLYIDIKNIDKLPKVNNLLAKLNDYAINNPRTDIYVIDFPKTDTDTEGLKVEGCFMLMNPNHKICIVNGLQEDNRETFDGYVYDVNQSLSYLYQKFEYRTHFARYDKWVDGLIVDDLNLDDIGDISIFFNSIEIDEDAKCRRANLLISLVIGSVNDPKKVGDEVPVNVLDGIKHRIQLFDADQTRFIYANLDKKCVKIQGLAGTGKTELLLHKLKELYTDNNKYSIFFTCHNKVLANDMRRRIPEFFDAMGVRKQIEWNTRIWCANAWGRFDEINSGLYRYLCHFYNVAYRGYKDVVSFEAACKMAIASIKSSEKFKQGVLPFDYILVDESQDFEENFIELCMMVTTKQVFLAGDVFQSIFSENKHDAEVDFFLHKCYRTDTKTLLFAHALELGLFERARLRWLDQSTWEDCGYVYEDMENSIKISREPINRFEDYNDALMGVEISQIEGEVDYHAICNHIINIIKQLKEQSEFSNIAANDIAIILLDADSYIYDLAIHLTTAIQDVFGWTVNKTYETKESDNESLVIANRNNVKGLEYPFVICYTSQLSDSYTYRNSLYTMLTRSFLKSYLVIPQVSSLNASIIEGLEEINRDKYMIIKKPSSYEERQIQTRFRKAQKQYSLEERIRKIAITMRISDVDLEKIFNMFQNISKKQYSDEELRGLIENMYRMIQGV